MIARLEPCRIAVRHTCSSYRHDLKDFCHAADASQNLKELSWEPIGNSDWSYVGTFDGNGKTITNLYINATQAYMGLFGRIYKSTIKNLTFENANVTNTENDIGILAGYAGNGNTLQNIKYLPDKRR